MQPEENEPKYQQDQQPFQDGGISHKVHPAVGRVEISSRDG